MSPGGWLPTQAMPSHNSAPDALERLAPIRFGREICGDLMAIERREWWIGNGRGAYAAGTIALTLTRRYHGLLIAPIDPPLGRSLVLAKADAELIVGEQRYPLFCQPLGKRRHRAGRSSRHRKFRAGRRNSGVAFRRRRVPG